MNRVKKTMCFFGVAFLCFAQTLAHAEPEKLKILTTTTDLADITRSITGQEADVSSIASGKEDSHFISARPSFIVQARDADVWIRIGMDLEIGWEPPILRDSRNRRIQEGKPGHIDVSESIIRMEVPIQKVTRDMGDIHPHGNPHYWLDPLNGRIVAKTIADRLSQLYPARKTLFQGNLRKFEKDLDNKMFGDNLVSHYGGARLWKLMLEDELPQTLIRDKQKEHVGGWYGTLLPFQGQPIVTYHKSWIYFTKRFGLHQVIELEPKPGITPSSKHLAKVIQTVRDREVRVILQEPFYSRKAADLIAQRTGASVVVCANTVGGDQEVHSYFELFDFVVSSLKRGMEK